MQRPGHHHPFNMSLATPSNSLSRHPALVQLQGILCWYAAAVGQAHAEGLNTAGHGVGCVHASAGTSTGAGVTDNVKALVLVNLASCVGTCSIEYQVRTTHITREQHRLHAKTAAAIASIQQLRIRAPY